MSKGLNGAGAWTAFCKELQESKLCGVIDGGLATELENRGADINDPLWSATCLLDENSSNLVRQVHLDYFEAGADIGITASYQASIQGFSAKGIDVATAEKLLQKSVELTCEARDIFWDKFVSVHSGSLSSLSRFRPLVAASIGSYGAYLADGSEYSGDYGETVTVDSLKHFHRRRLQVLSSSGADILAIETIPSLQEAEAIVELLEEENPPIPALMSFNSMDGQRTVRGDRFEDCVRLVDSCEHVVAVGINCTAPRHILSLITSTREATAKPLIVYPNSGEEWDSVNKEWVLQDTDVSSTNDFAAYAPIWWKAGATLIGGCCRTTPDTIRAIRLALSQSSTDAAT